MKETLTGLIALAVLVLPSTPAIARNTYFDTALRLNGVDEYVEVDAAIIPPSGDFSLSVWARANSLPSGPIEILSQEGGSEGVNFYLGRLHNGNIRVGDDWGDSGAQFPMDGQWHFYTVVRSSSDTFLYVDGVSKAQRGAPIRHPAGSRFRIGRQYGGHGEYFDGDVDEIRAWSVARTETEIREGMYSPLSGDEAGLVSYWQFDDSQKSRTVDHLGNHTGRTRNMNDSAWVPSSVPDETFSVTFARRADSHFPAGTPEAETIAIPKHRPVYALLVSGFHQNKNFELFHFYDFAECLIEKGAYVHYSWWNNLLEPYMEGPLWTDDSVPSYEAFPLHDYVGWSGSYTYPNKALPGEDYQFQDDASEMLRAIRENNPDAAIILVGHSMGGDAVVRLADSPNSVDIDLLAPIDPVGNRTCLPVSFGQFPWPYPYCAGSGTFKRFYAVREDNAYYFPPKRYLEPRVGFLYHRWQHEAVPPWDFAMEEIFNYHESRIVGSVTQALSEGSTNIQSYVPTSPDSGLDVYPPPPIENSGGWVDGHGEIVGFRGVVPNANVLAPESYPMGLKALGDWPTGRDPDLSFERANHMRNWEFDEHYIADRGFEPRNPEYCKVSGDLCRILREAIYLPPVADAGLDQKIATSSPDGTRVFLDASGSLNDIASYTWEGPFGEVTAKAALVPIPVGTHIIHLTVMNDTGDSDEDTLFVTVPEPTFAALYAFALLTLTLLRKRAGGSSWESANVR